MRIDAITSCVGELYSGYLERTLPAWFDTCDSITIVKDEDGFGTVHLWDGRGLMRFVKTDAFTRYGASFNKGAALNVAYAAAQPTDWVLHFDCDMLPPSDWRTVFESQAQPGCIYGAPRFSTEGASNNRLDRPIGYFQLWHVSDPASWRWPIFQTWHAHAGAYDVEFLEQWPTDRWRMLPIRLTHLGRGHRNWFGVHNQAQMQAFLKTNIKKYRHLARENGHGRLPIPNSPKFAVPRENAPLVAEALAIARRTGPFGVWVNASPDLPADWEPLESLEVLERYVNCDGRA